MALAAANAADLLRLGLVGLTSRRTRAALSALGIAIGIASMVAVLSLSQSSKADLIAQLDALGTNLLEVTPGSTATGTPVPLPPLAPAMARRIPPVDHLTALTQVDAVVRRNPLVPESRGSGISVLVSDLDLLETLQAHVATGRWLDRATERLPGVVLGAVAAERLGIDRLNPDLRIWLGDYPFAVLGILKPLLLTPTIDRSVLLGRRAAAILSPPPFPSEMFVRVAPDQVLQVSDVLGPAVDPLHPTAALVERPSDAISARIAAKSAFTALFFGLGLVALLVGGVGVANVMIISVLERRSEVGLRRAMGATRAMIRLQFLSEAVLLTGIGGVAGATLGLLASSTYCVFRGWPIVVSPAIVAAGIVGSFAIGTLAGIYPAARAARLSPAEALRAV